MVRMFCIFTLLSILPGIAVQGQDFLSDQLAFPRVREARNDKDDELRTFWTSNRLLYPPHEIFLRTFKQEAVLELWARDADTARWVLMKEYPICERSGIPGPKRKEGDLQVPEGFYYINIFNPTSTYYLSLGINYPNASDSVLGIKPRLGGDIMIHGDCVTIGCIPIQDDRIKEVYWLAVQARAGGQERIPVHIFPRRLDQAGMKTLEDAFEGDAGRLAFWKTLQPGYEAFEATHRIPVITIDSLGTYRLSPR